MMGALAPPRPARLRTEGARSAHFCPCRAAGLCAADRAGVALAAAGVRRAAGRGWRRGSRAARASRPKGGATRAATARSAHAAGRARPQRRAAGLRARRLARPAGADRQARPGAGDSSGPGARRGDRPARALRGRDPLRPRRHPGPARRAQQAIAELVRAQNSHRPRRGGTPRASGPDLAIVRAAQTAARLRQPRRQRCRAGPVPRRHRRHRHGQPDGRAPAAARPAQHPRRLDRPTARSPSPTHGGRTTATARPRCRAAPRRGQPPRGAANVSERGGNTFFGHRDRTGAGRSGLDLR